MDAAARAHDAALRALGLDIWVGSEPTFTDRFLFEPEWTCAALGEDKRRRAEDLIVRLAAETPGAALLRSVGRYYRGEAVPRWSYGLLARRDGTPLWHGPPDPLLAPGPWPAPDLRRFADLLITAARAGGRQMALLPSTRPAELRLLLGAPPADPAEPRLARPSCHDAPPADGWVHDDLAQEGRHLFLLRGEGEPGREAVRLELPALPDPAALQTVLEWAAAAARRAGLPVLVLAGFPPPADASLAWTTLTPDPAVLEVNMAPYPGVADLLAQGRRLFAAARDLGLAPYRLWYNGDQADSGGAGHITLGGPSPRRSPFLLQPALLPRLVRYANRHPSLSYFFAHEHIGSCGQSVRSDERDREHFEELGLALELLARQDAPPPEAIGRSLGPFLADMAGNTHRAELNIEKFWNPGLGGRGCLGLVEFRAPRMAASPERLAALAALLRSVAARLALRPFEKPLADWGAELHDRFALPFHLRRDLAAVLADLEDAGCPLPPPLAELLLEDDFRQLGRVAAQGVELTVTRALEFWPLVGDAASQEPGTSRLVDASTTRVELCLRGAAGNDGRDLAGWQLAAQGFRLPLRTERDDAGPARLFALRYRRFEPWAGLHPALPAQGPIELLLWHDEGAAALRITLHEWRPDGGPYEGLPEDPPAARARRQARVTWESAPLPGPLPPPPARALTPWCLDLRQPAALAAPCKAGGNDVPRVPE